MLNELNYQFLFISFFIVIISVISGCVPIDDNQSPIIKNTTLTDNVVLSGTGTDIKVKASSSSTGNWRKYTSTNTWSEIYSGNANNVYDGTGSQDIYTRNVLATRYYNAPASLDFDTSSIPDDATVTNAVVYVYVTGSESWPDNDAQAYIGLTPTSLNTPGTLSTADYQNINYTLISNTVSGSLSAGNISFTILSEELDLISKTGNTQFAIVEGHAIENSPIAAGQQNYVTMTPDMSYIVITYETAVSDSCTYSSGNHTYDCGDDCVLSSPVSVDAGAHITISGTGTISGVRYIQGADKIIIQGGCLAIA